MKKVLRVLYLLPLFLVSSEILAEPQLHLKIFRPGTGETDFFILAKKQFADVYLPYSNAPVVISNAQGKKFQGKTNSLGRMTIPIPIFMDAQGQLSEGTTLKASVAVGKVKAEDELAFTAAELASYKKLLSDFWTQKGNTAAGASNYVEAARCYEEALLLDPEHERAAYNVALAYEKAGMKHLAIARYSTFLTAISRDPKSRSEAKARVIAISKTLNPMPQVPKVAGNLVQEAGGYFRSNESEALSRYEMAQSLAPWWPEPYYGAGVVYEYLGNQKDPLYYSAAILNYEFFLDSAKPNDERAKQARERLTALKRIDQGISGARK